MKLNRILQYFALLVTVSISLANSNVSSASADSFEHSSVAKWKSADKAGRKFASQLFKTMLPLVVQASQELNLTSQCSRSLMKFLNGIKQMKLWAFRMLDTSGKVPNGILSGSINSLGDYDGCLATQVPGHFGGKYCLLQVAPPLPPRRPFVSSDAVVEEFVNITDSETITGRFLELSNYFYHLNIRTSVCVPSTCSKEDVEAIGNKVMEYIGMDFPVVVPNCEVAGDEVEFTPSQIVIVIVLSILVLLGVTSTITDVILKLRSKEDSYQEKQSFSVRCLLCFSFYTNTQRLLKKDTSPDSIKVFHGMKVITILWVILNHTYYYLNYQGSSGLLNAREIGKEKAVQFITNGFLNVETFFFISAVLVAYGVMKMKEKRINIFLFIFRRFWRLTPPFMLVIACVFLLPHVGSGPIWKETVVQGLTEKCKNYWWSNLVYINNFISGSEMCLQWTWYIPVDTHLYFLSLLVLVHLKQNPKRAFFINGVILIVGIIVTAVLNVYYGLHPTAIYVYNHPEDITYYIDRGYFRTYLHCSTYCVGLSVGYLIVVKKNIRIPLLANTFAWLSAFVVALSVLYGVYEWNQGNVPGIATSTLYTCTNKLAWSLSLAWVTFACMTGNGGFVTDFLSWEAFVPLGRLTYMAYLVHPIIQFLYIGSTRTLIRTAHRTLLYMYLGNVVLAFMCAYGLSLLFESPFMALEKVFFSSRRAPTPKDQGTGKEDKQSQLEKEVSATSKKGNSALDARNIFLTNAVLDDQNNYLGKENICTIKITKLEPNY